MATEKRLIDANKLPYSIAVDDNGKQIFYVKAEDIDKAPAVDAVEVVRCKDCKHCKKYRNRLDPMLNHQLCVRMDNYAWCVEEDDFCSYGERRADA